MFDDFKNLSRDAWQTIVGVCCIKIATGVLSCWGSINLYILSYFYHEGMHVEKKTNSMIILFTIVPMSFIVLLATKISQKYGYQRVIKVCGFIFFASPLMIYYRFNMVIFNVFCVFLPISAYAISSISVINCLWTQFPKSRNKATAIAVVSFGLGGIFWNYLFTITVNPDNQTTTLTDPNTGMNFFDVGVTHKVLSCMKVGFLMCGSLFVIGTFLVKKNSQYRDSYTSEDREMKLFNTNINSPLLDIKQGMIASQQPKQRPPKLKQKRSLKSALMDSRFISIFMISFLSGTYQVFINMNLKIIYMPIVNDDRFLVYCAMIGTAVSIFGAFIWGYVGDKYGFLSSLFVFTVIDCVIKIYGTFAVTKPTIIILFILIGCTDKAMLTIMGPGLVKMFGIEIATELLPYKGFSVFLSFLLAPIGYLLLSDVVSPFKYLMIIVICSVISVILSIRLYSQRKKK